MATGGQKTEFTVEAKDKTKRGLASAQKNLKKTSKEANSLAMNFRNVARATVVMEGPLGGTAGRLSAVATMLGNVNLAAVGVGAAVTATTAVMYQSMKAFSAWEQQTLKINQLLEQTGYAAGVTGDEIEDMSLRIGRNTLASADDVRAASAVLLTFKSVAGDAFGRTMEVASDLAALTGQDLKQSVIQLGKALEDPMTGMSALRRSGVSFTNSQKEMIVQMKKTGDVAGAQNEILALLEGQLGGAGKAAGGGLAGAADLVAENWSNMLIKLADSGAGETATAWLNEMGMVLQWVGHLIKPDDAIRLLEVQEEIAKKQGSINSMTIEERKSQQALVTVRMRDLGALRREQKQIESRMALKKEEVEVAREKSRVEQKAIQEAQLAEAKFEAGKKAAREAAKAEEKAGKEASGYAQKLIDEDQKFQMSLLNKGHQEDIYLEQRLTKIQENLDAERLTKDEALAAEAAAYSLHNSKLTEIHKEESEKKAAAEKKLKEMQIAATSEALSDIGSMMSSSSSHLFKVGKMAAVANALINTYQAVTKTMASVPYPLNIPLAAAQGVAGMVQVQKIKQQKMAARMHGGMVIGGRSYMVGERGPELFTAPRTGQIINNSATNNVGGQTNIFNVTQVMESDESFIQRNAVKIWDNIVDKMNEEGVRFA